MGLQFWLPFSKWFEFKILLILSNGVVIGELRAPASIHRQRVAQLERQLSRLIAEQLSEIPSVLQLGDAEHDGRGADDLESDTWLADDRSCEPNEVVARHERTRGRLELLQLLVGRKDEELLLEIELLDGLRPSNELDGRLKQPPDGHALRCILASEDARLNLVAGAEGSLVTDTLLAGLDARKARTNDVVHQPGEEGNGVAEQARPLAQHEVLGVLDRDGAVLAQLDGVVEHCHWPSFADDKRCERQSSSRLRIGRHDEAE